MRHFVSLPLLLLTLSACAAPGTVQRLGVEYNTALAGMANELALLNIVRAKEDLPLHYTSISRLSGSLIIKASGGLNGQLRESTQTIGDVDTTTVAPAGTTVTEQLTRQVVEGGNLYIPSLGGELTTGPSFDVAILDGQRFYQGIMGAIPFSTIENYLDQGMDNELLLRLLVQRIEYRALEAGNGYAKDEVVRTFTNAVSGDEAQAFADEVACYELRGVGFRRPARPVMPLSRVTSGPDGQLTPMTIEEVARLDGTSLELSDTVLANGSTDAIVTINRVFPERRVARLVPRSECNHAFTLQETDVSPPRAQNRDLPLLPPANPIYTGDGEMMVVPPGANGDVRIKVGISITFRSTEGVIRFLGQYLDAAEHRAAETYRLGQQPLFSLASPGDDDLLVSTTLAGHRYAIADQDDNSRRNMRVLGLVQQLVNLHKDSADRPVTQAVQIIP